MARETSKNYDMRINNGDFEKYLNGKGIDIGGGQDCLKLPKNISGSVQLYDFINGDAQYLHGIKDETYDFAYSSHCLEHMRNIDCAFLNWIRVVKKGGYLYVCVPHALWYEKGKWPSAFNSDHKWSFSVDKMCGMPKNILVKEFLNKYIEYIDIIDIRENLMNYDYSLDPCIDQTLDYEKRVCAQIDFIVRRKNMDLPKENNRKYWNDFFLYYCPMRMKMSVKRIIRQIIGDKVNNV